MKYSRDLALQELNDSTFDQVIDNQVKTVADTGATYVAIATPYDEKFVPFLTKWVNAARKYGLHVWFRGNFSGWEGWFGTSKKLTRENHLALTRQFIKSNPDLFKDGDIFSPCPECENGGPGDPRNHDPKEFRDFIISENNAANEEFKKIGKNVTTNFFPMNYDVAKLIMDKDTAKQMGNLIVIDHYVKYPSRLADDIDQLAATTGANIFLGEFGAPVPDINGQLSDQDQADWLNETLRLIRGRESVIGLNYWVGVGGSTAVFNSDLTPKPAAEILRRYYKLETL